MTETTKSTDREQVTAHIEKLEPTLAENIKLLREIILNADKNIGERIKWNNPSFYYTGEMKPFDPKEYKRDIIVMNLYKGRIMLVFPSGAKVNDQSGFLQGNYADGRRTVVLENRSDIDAKKESLQRIIKQWLQLVEK